MPKDQKYCYNRHLDNLHLKASEMLSLLEEAEFKVIEKERIEIAIKAIINGSENQFISIITNLSLDKIVELRKEINK